MPPKKGKKKGKKGKKKAEESAYPALMEYKIAVQTKEVEMANEELSRALELNQGLQQRVQRLKETRDYHFKKALEDYMEFKAGQGKLPVVEKDEVVNEMKELWRFKRAQEQNIVDLKQTIKDTKKEIGLVNKEIKYWQDFIDRGQIELDTEIRLLNSQLHDMQENYEIISSHIENQLARTLQEIERNTEETIQLKNKTAAQRALKQMDKDTVKMSHDNEWMATKIELYKKELDELKAETNGIEEENVRLMTYLCDCNAEDLKLIKRAFDTQFIENENIEKNAILGVDLNDIDSDLEPNSLLEETMYKIRQIELRNKERLAQANFAISHLSTASNASSETEEHDDDDDVVQDEYLSLGRYEYKRLTLTGYKKPIFKPPTPSKEESKAIDFRGDNWPITHEMLCEALSLT